jgi:hypothetical protein
VRDFTIGMFENLCVAFMNSDYKFITFSDYLSKHRPQKSVILRHDVDMNPENALKLGLIEYKLGIRASYYFRIVNKSLNPSVLTRLSGLGHEIGYHYEDISKARGNVQEAVASFKRNLAILRQSYPVRTICMHGSPLSKWDNRLLWQHCNYRDFGIIGEPYFDVNFDEVLYLTDTGRSWNGVDNNIRDKVQSELRYVLRSTGDIIRALYSGNLPQKIMLNIHPQRWHDRYAPWLKELIWQNTKNIGKRILVTRK